MTWLPPKPWHSSVLFHTSRAALPILPYASHSSSWHPALATPPLRLPSTPLSPCLGWHLSLWPEHHFLYGLLKTTTGPGAGRDQPSFASLMARLLSYTACPSLPLKYLDEHLLSLPPVVNSRSWSVLHIPWRLWHRLSVSFHACSWHRFRHIYTRGAQCHL